MSSNQTETRPSQALIEQIFTSYQPNNTKKNSLIDLQVLQEDSSSKRFSRVAIKSESKSKSKKSESKTGSETYILMEIPHTAISRSDEFFVIDRWPFETTQAELWIAIATFLKANLPRTPEIYGTKFLNDRQALVLIQDLGSTTLYDLLHDPNIPRNPIRVGHAYEEVIHWIARLQELGQNTSQQHLIKSRRLERQAMILEVEEFLRFLSGQGKGLYSQTDLEEIMLEFITICQEIEQGQPFTLVHRDFQSKNIMYYQGEPYVIDLQDLCQGPILYDLATLLYDQNAQLEALERQRLAKIYWEHYGSTTKSLGYLDFLRKLRLTGLQRNIHSTGRHATLYFQKQRQDSLARVKRGLLIFQSLEQDLKEEELALFRKVKAEQLLKNLPSA